VPLAPVWPQGSWYSWTFWTSWTFTSGPILWILNLLTSSKMSPAFWWQQQEGRQIYQQWSSGQLGCCLGFKFFWGCEMWGFSILNLEMDWKMDFWHWKSHCPIGLRKRFFHRDYTVDSRFNHNSRFRKIFAAYQTWHLRVQSTLDMVNTICSSILFTLSSGTLYREWNFLTCCDVQNDNMDL